MRIKWEDAAVQHEFEDMVAVLLQLVHPDALHIDGAGGDEGRDVILETGDGVLIFECKRFTGRLSDSRKAQIRNSLKRAAQHKPRAWHLVVPIDPNPHELKFFKGLGKNYDFPLVWRGRTWLDAQMSSHPVVERYFLGNAQRELYDLLKDLPIAVDQLGSASDAMQRIEHLHSRLNELDIHYEYALSTGAAAQQPPPPLAVLSKRSGDLRIDVVPRYRGALEARPIRGSFTVQFDPDQPELRDAFQRAMDFGDAVEVPPGALQSFDLDAPGGLGGNLSGGGLRIEGLTRTPAQPVPVRARVLEPGGRLVQEIALTMSEFRGGARGGTLYGSDSSDQLHVEVRHDGEARTANVNFSYRPRPLPPAAVRSVSDFLAALEQGRTIELTFGNPPRPALRAELGQDIGMLPAWFTDVADAFEQVQRRVRATFEMPVDLTEEEVHEILELAAELDPAGRAFTWNGLRVTLAAANGDVDEVMGSLLSRSGGAFLLVQDLTWIFRGQHYDLGPQRIVIEHAVVDNVDEVREFLTSGREAPVRLVPGRSRDAVARLLDPDDPTLPKAAS